MASNLAGIRTSGENAWDTYIKADPNWESLELVIIKDSQLMNEKGTFLSLIKKGTKVKLLSNEKFPFKTTFVAHIVSDSCCGFIQLNRLSKPLYGDRVKNKGDVSEGLLACGIASSFFYPYSKATEKEIHELISTFRESGKDSFSFLVPRTNNIISLTIRLSNPSFKELLDVSKFNLLKSEVQSVLSFANSSHITQYSYVLRDSRVEIVADGLSDQRGTKVDLSVRINGELSAINLSLKAGATKQLGQVSGCSLEKQEEFWGLFGINPLDERLKRVYSVTQPEEWLHSVYKIAASKLDNGLCDEDFIATLASGIKHAAVLGDDSVSLVHLSGGSYKLMRFDKLLDKLLEHELECVYHGTAIMPTVFIQDRNTKERLISMRAKRENRNNSAYFRNYIEKQELLIKLLTV